MKGKELVRSLHLLSGAVVGSYLYSPWSQIEWFILLNQVIAAPVLILSGIWMWKGHRITKINKK